MEWQDVPETVDLWVEKTAQPAAAVRRAAAGVLTASHIGYYYHPVLEKVALFAPLANVGDQARCKAAAARGVGKDQVRGLFLSYQELSDPNTSWVKVAHSPALHRLGELLNFYPGQLPGGVPNHPSPLAALLTSGLVGAGLGWGAGTLAGKVLPQGVGNNLGRTGMLLGGALGAAPALAWGLANKGVGRNFNDPSLMTQKGVDFPTFMNGRNWKPLHAPEGEQTSELPEGVSDYAGELHRRAYMMPEAIKASVDQGLAGVQLGTRYKQAVIKLAESATFGSVPPPVDRTPVDVNIDALGRTLWDTGASPNLAATTMGAMYAAQQLPDPRSRPGWVTGEQLGQLAANTAGDYAKGLLVGAALNTVIGTPLSATSYGAANAALGLIGAVVPKLFGG